jgi:NAD dependent epimerase/dehydratase family
MGVWINDMIPEEAARRLREAEVPPRREGWFMRVLVTGGAGYIGSVVAAQLVAAGHEVTVLDDLSTGHADAVPAEATFIKGSLRCWPMTSRRSCTSPRSR